MKAKIKLLIPAILFATVFLAAADSALQDALPQAAEDLGDVKIKAEKGDLEAQMKLADAYLSRNKSADALKWYEAAARQNSLDAEVKVGELFLFGRGGSPKEQQIEARPTDGLKLMYDAATQGHKGAWRNMAKAAEAGVGCATNNVEAYAWLLLLTDAGESGGKSDLNDLVLRLSTDEIQRGKKLMQEMKAGNWPPLTIQKPKPVEVEVELELKVSGIIAGSKTRIATINGTSVVEGDEARVRSNKGVVKLRCLKVSPDSATVLVDGENEVRILRIGDSGAGTRSAK